MHFTYMYINKSIIKWWKKDLFNKINTIFEHNLFIIIEVNSVIER